MIVTLQKYYYGLLWIVYVGNNLQIDLHIILKNYAPSIKYNSIVL